LEPACSSIPTQYVPHRCHHVDGRGYNFRGKVDAVFMGIIALYQFMGQTLPAELFGASFPQSSVLKQGPLAPGPSIILDAVRFLAALTVAVGHLSQPYFTTGWPPLLMDFAVGAVSVFFILSGFMIRYVTAVKFGAIRGYTADRLARIYSVALPALALTIFFQIVSAHFNYSYYHANFGGTNHASHIPLLHALLSHPELRGVVRYLGTITMLSESWFQDAIPRFNSPFWSLSYECAYYALFGIFLYLRGHRRIVAWIIVFLLIGPAVFLMFPIWLLGCAAHDVYQQGIWNKSSLLKLSGFSLLSLAGVHGSRAVVERFHLLWFNTSRVDVVSMDIVGIATVAVILPLCMVTRNLHISEKHIAIRGIRRAASATFPLYLIHFPLFALLAAIVPYPRASLLAKLLLLAAALALSFFLSPMCDRLKNYLRRLLAAPWVITLSPHAPPCSSIATEYVPHH
jgi:peptidoglycan/LPS O-acetylase OafA/YrhL